MCEPATLTLIAAGMAAVGTGVTAVSQYQQGQYQAKVADNNAKLENEAARDAIERGRTESQRYQRELSQKMGAQRASLAANNIDINFGSAAAVRGDTALFGQEDVATIRENSMRESKGFEIGAANYTAEGVGARIKATGALVSGAFSAGSTLLGAANQYKNPKLAR